MFTRCEFLMSNWVNRCINNVCFEVSFSYILTWFWPLEITNIFCNTSEDFCAWINRARQEWVLRCYYNTCFYAIILYLVYCLNITWILEMFTTHAHTEIKMVLTHWVRIFLKFVCVFLTFSWLKHKFQNSRQNKQISMPPLTTTYLVLNEYGLVNQVFFVFLFTSKCTFTVPGTVKHCIFIQNLSLYAWVFS